MASLKDIALQYHAWGASVNAIRKGSKATINTWKDLHERPQERAEVEDYSWKSAGGVGVNNGPGGWHTFDLDAFKDKQGNLTHGEVPETTLLALLDALRLPSDYAWVWRGKGGWALALRCGDNLPTGVFPAKKNEAGVFWGWPATESNYNFHHIELRWTHNQTVYPPSKHPSGVAYQWRGEVPSCPPAVVRVARIIEAFYTLCPPPPHTLGSIDDTTKATIRQQFDLVAYAKHVFGGDERREGDEVRITGNGGLLIKPASQQWYCHRDEIGGDCFDLVAFDKYQTRAQNLNGKSAEILQLAAQFAGVSLPTRQPQTTQATATPSLQSATEPPPYELQPLLDIIARCEGRAAVEDAALSDEVLVGAATLGRRDLLLLQRAIAERTTKGFGEEWAKAVRAHNKPAIARAAWPIERPASVALSSDEKDPGLVKRLADAITAEYYFAADGGGKLYVWRAGVYQADGDQHVARRVKALLEEWGETQEWSSHRSNETAIYIATDAPLLWERPPLDIVNVRNGLLNVTTGVLEPHRPEHLSPVQLPIKHDPAATCPAWDQFIADVFPDDAAQAGVPWELAAWLMTPDTSIQKAILLSGEGANGKSTFLAALIAFIGKHNAVALSLQQLEENRFSAARLVGKLANICPDLPSKHLAETSTFKALLGGDTITVERKHVDSFDYTPFARLIFSANHPPRSADATFAFFRRWLVIPFEKTFEGKAVIPRAELDARLANPRELSGVLNRALTVAARVRQNGITETQSMRAAWDEFRQTTDPLAVWLGKATIQGSDVFTAKSDLLTAYNEACDRMGQDVPRMSGNAFGRALRRAMPDVQEAQRTVNGKSKVWVWIGIGLKEVEPDVTGIHGNSRHSRDSAYCKILSENSDGIDTAEVYGTPTHDAYSANRENRVNGVNSPESRDITPSVEGAPSIVSCDHKGNISPYGQHWLAILPDGTHTEPTAYRDVAEKAYQRAIIVHVEQEDA